MKGVVLVTGASSGIGRACVRRLDQSGFRVFAGVRKIEDGEALKVEVSHLITPVLMDLALPDTLTHCAQIVAAGCAELPFAGVVNNAGTLVTGPVEYLPIEDLRQQLEVNVVGQVALIQALLPLLRKFKGRIVNIGSSSGHIPSPFAGAYCASKFAMRAISDVLRQELASARVAVSLIEPGVIATPLWKKALVDEARLEAGLPDEGRERYGALFAARRKLFERLMVQGGDPEIVAASVEKALTSRKPRDRYIVGWDARFKLLVFPFLPAALLGWLRSLRQRK